MITGKDHQKSMRHIFTSALVLVVLTLSLVVMSTYARDTQSAEPAASRAAIAVASQPTQNNSEFDIPVGLYVQEWNRFSEWKEEWNSWAAGPMMREWYNRTEVSGRAQSIDFLLKERYNEWTFGGTTYAPIPDNKKLLIGFYPKNSVTTDCWYGMPKKWYTTSYGALPLKNGATRTCVGKDYDGDGNLTQKDIDQARANGDPVYTITTTVDFTNDEVKKELGERIMAFVEYYTNHEKASYIAGFSFASGNNQEATPWIHDTSSKTWALPGEKGYEKATYESSHSGSDWAEYNLWFATKVQKALVAAGSDKIAYINYTQRFPSPTQWRNAVLCIGGVESPLCNESSSYAPLPSPANGGQIGLKHSGLAADTITGGSLDGICSWYREEPDEFYADFWNMMQWAHDSQGMSTNWEFNGDTAIGPLLEIYGNERSHLRHSLAMALSYGADVILIYPNNTEHTDILEWAARYVGKKVDSSLDQPVWAMPREAIEDNNEENKDNFDGTNISDPEDDPDLSSPAEDDGFSCETEKVTCWCGHDKQTGFGITTDDVNGIENTSFGAVKVDPLSEYGATARRAATDKIKFEVDDVYWETSTQAKIVVRYKLEGNHPVLKYWRKDDGTEATLSNNNPMQIPHNSGWYEATFTAIAPDFGSTNTRGYDFAIDPGSGDPDWIHYVEVARQDVPATPIPDPTATPTSTPTPEPAPSFRERMEVDPKGSFSSYVTINGATLTRVSDPHLEGSYAWKCAEGSQLQNWPQCYAYYNLPSQQDHLTLQYAVYIEEAVSSIGPPLWSSGGGLLWPYFDIFNQLHIYCNAILCGEFVDEIYANDPLAANTWYTIQIQVTADSIKVTAYHDDTVSDSTLAILSLLSSKAPKTG